MFKKYSNILGMLRTADSIQNNFDIISTFEDESTYGNGNSLDDIQENHNLNQNQ